MPSILILFQDLNPDHLASLLPHGWRFLSLEEAMRAGWADVIVLDGRFNSDKRLYTIKSALKSRIYCPQLTNKVELHELVRGNEITPPSWTISRWDTQGFTMQDHRPHIWRPEHGWKGQGVQVITTQEELDRLRMGLDDDLNEDESRAVLSEYITHPLLLEGRKLNVRLYLIVATHRRGAALLKRGLIGVGREPYVCGKFENMAIHDSRTLVHRDYRFPDDFPGGADAANQFFKQAEEIFDDVIQRVAPKSYGESKYGFEVLGCDLMMDVEASRVRLIEMNHKPGHQQLLPQNQEWLSRVVCEGIAQFALSLPTPSVAHQYTRVGIKPE